MSADKKTVRDTGGSFEKHPADVYAARCVDCIDLGLNPERFQDYPEELRDKVALVFRTAWQQTDGSPGEIGIEFNCVFGKKANLRKFVESWRGKAYTEEEAREKGVPLEKFVGVPALLTIIHRTSRTGNEYAAIGGISKLPAAMAALAPSAEGYRRPEFWEKKKLEYAEATKKFTARGPAGTTVTDPDYDPPAPDAPAEDDDLPF